MRAEPLRIAAAISIEAAREGGSTSRFFIFLRAAGINVAFGLVGYYFRQNFSLSSVVTSAFEALITSSPAAATLDVTPITFINRDFTMSIETYTRLCFLIEDAFRYFFIHIT
jgi:hypothetical protein